MWTNWLVPGVVLAIAGGAVVWLIVLTIVTDVLRERHERGRAPNVATYPIERTQDRLTSVH